MWQIDYLKICSGFLQLKGILIFLIKKIKKNKYVPHHRQVIKYIKFLACFVSDLERQENEMRGNNLKRDYKEAKTTNQFDICAMAFSCMPRRTTKPNILLCIHTHTFVFLNALNVHTSITSEMYSFCFSFCRIVDRYMYMCDIMFCCKKKMLQFVFINLYSSCYF